MSEQEQYVDMWTYECLAFVLYTLLQFVFIGKIQVFVKIILQGAKTIVISVYPTDTVEKLKQLIEEKEGISNYPHWLHIAGTGKPLLKEELTISDFG